MVWCVSTCMFVAWFVLGFVADVCGFSCLCCTVMRILVCWCLCWVWVLRAGLGCFPVIFCLTWGWYNIVFWRLGWCGFVD